MTFTARLTARQVRASVVLAIGLWCAFSPAPAIALQSGGPAAQTEAAPAPQTCANECHKEITGRKVMHGPANSDCGTCHVQTGEAKDHKFAYVVAKEQLCLRCHAIPHEAVMHLPVRDGKCMDCHDPHGSDHRRVLLADPKRDLCLRCHKQDIAKMKFVHGPVAVGACIVCHKAHSSTQPNLLVQDAKSLCLTCHAEVQAKSEQGMHMHAALEQGCTRCHDAHASNHHFQLHEEAPGLCLSCHKERFDQMIAGAKVVHGAITAEGGCTGCHEPHSSKLPSLQRGTQPGVCLRCHDKELAAPDGTHIVNMAGLLEQNPDKHGPVREGACTACHSPHAGQHFRLLSEDYPQQFYAPFNLDTFKLCFKCHIPDIVLKPSARNLTQFRDGDRNLHWLHVNQEKGRTCRACHEVHASKRPSHIREAVPFGSSGWMLEINYEKSKEGGSCSPGCHKERTYSRTNPSTSPLPRFNPSGVEK